MSRNRIKSGLSLAALVAAATAALPVAAQQDELPQKTKEGLDRIESDNVQALYWLEGATLSQYKRIGLVDCQVAFRKDWMRDQNRERRELSQRITDADMARIQNLLEEEFIKVFTEELEKGGYEVVDVTGEDVLLLRPSLVNLDVAAPDLQRGSQRLTGVVSAGSMTLYMEFRDSLTNQLIGQVADAQAAPQRNTNFQLSSGVNNRAEADLILRHWAGLLVNALHESMDGAPGAD